MSEDHEHGEVIAHTPFLAAMTELYAALAEFQTDLPVVTNMDLAAVVKEILPRLGELGVAYVCTTIEGSLIGRLVHRSGAYVESQWMLPYDADPQVMGSAMTYGRRYMLLAMCGAHPEGEDDNGEKAAAAWQKQRDETRTQPVEPPVDAAEPQEMWGRMRERPYTTDEKEAQEDLRQAQREEAARVNAIPIP